MTDAAHEWTDKWIAKTERSIMRLYADSKERMAELIESELEELDESYESGELDEQTILMARLGYGGRLARRLAEMAVKTDREALELASARTKDVYKKNAGFMLLALFLMFEGLEVSWDSEHVDAPSMSVDVDKDWSWNLRKMAAAVLSVTTDKAPSKGSVEAVSRVVDMDMRFALRSARTLATRTEAAARLDAMRAASRAGAKVEKQWVAVMDERTRQTHAELDGTHVPLDEPFVTSKGAELMYPADPDCHEPSEVYNCRCTLRAWSKEG